MYKIEEIKKQFIENGIEYYEKNFSGKNFGKALYDVLLKELMLLSKVYLRFLMLKTSLEIISNDKKLIQYLPKYHLEMLYSTIKDVDLLCEKLYDIIEPIVDGVNE